jgi:PAS domain S-box-containing protein
MQAASDDAIEPLSSGENLSARLLARIVDRVAHPIFVKDRAFRFVLLNEALSAMTGFAKVDMLGRTDHDFFPPDEADFFRRKDEEVFATGARIVVEEEWITDAQGNRHLLATTKVPILGENGQPTHLVGIIHDITSLKQAEAALREANEACEQRLLAQTAKLEEARERLVRKERLAALGELAGGVAHQIRNPLAAIHNAYTLARQRLAQGDVTGADAALAIIGEEVQAANGVVTDLLDYARVRPVTPRDVSLGYLLEQAVGAQIIPASIAVLRNVPEGIVARVDASQVQSAIANVLRNAVEAMPAGGTLLLEAWREPTDGREGGEQVAVAVSDTGHGIDPSLRERLFEPLVTTKKHGVGLGLSTALALIENQGGSLSFEPCGKGARFVMRFPASHVLERS